MFHLGTVFFIMLNKAPFSIIMFNKTLLVK